MPIIEVDYYDHPASRGWLAQLSAERGCLLLEGSFGRRVEPITAVEFAAGDADLQPTIYFANGARCVIRDRIGLTGLLSAAGNARLAAARKSGGRARLLIFGFIVLALVMFHQWVVPWAARVFAPQVSERMISDVSIDALQKLDRSSLLPSQLSEERQRAIREHFETVLTHAGSVPRHRLVFRAAPAIGPNAFALPAGDIVVLDELVGLTIDDMEVAAVLAHELGHIALRHGVRQILHGGVITYVRAAVAGDTGGIASNVAGVAMKSSYPREFEDAADEYAGRILIAATGSTRALESVLTRLDLAQALRRATGAASQLPSHPLAGERMVALRQLGLGT